MNHKKSIPTVATSQGKVCPVCGRTSYSRGGIHPQCSVFQADAKIARALHRRPKPR